MTWEAQFVGGELDGTVRTFPGDGPGLTVWVQLPRCPPEVPEPVWVRYRVEVGMDSGRPAWRLVLDTW